MAAIEPKVANLLVPPQPLHFLQPTQPLLLVGRPYRRVLVHLQHLDADPVTRSTSARCNALASLSTSSARKNAWWKSK